MSLKEFKDAYYYYTSMVSSVGRQVAFAGIAIVWIFRMGSEQEISLPKGLLYSTVALVVCLAFDFLHYLTSSMVWGIYHRVKEKTHNSSEELKAPGWINWPGLLFFWSKSLALVIGYYFLITFLINKVKFI